MANKPNYAKSLYIIRALVHSKVTTATRPRATLFLVAWLSYNRTPGMATWLSTSSSADRSACTISALQRCASPILSMPTTPTVTDKQHLLYLELLGYFIIAGELSTLAQQHLVMHIRAWQNNPLTLNRTTHIISWDQLYQLTHTELLSPVMPVPLSTQDHPAAIQILVWYYLLCRRADPTVKQLRDLLSKTPVHEQRLHIYRFCDMLTRLYDNMPLKRTIQGLQLTIKGKINRTGSARKQKLVWRLGKLSQTDCTTALYNCRDQASTITGALGISGSFSFKAEINV